MSWVKCSGPAIVYLVSVLFWANAFAVQAGVAAGVKGRATVEGNDRPGAETIKSGGVILTNDTLVTGANSRMQALLVDETALTLGPNSSLTIDRFVYDPNKGSGEVVANMLRGSLRFVSGRSAALGNPQFKIKTPVGVMGIRGTQTMAVETEPGKFFMGLIGPGPENNVGLPPSKMEFENEYGSQTVDQAGVGFFVEVNQPPGDLIPVPAEISNLFVNKTPPPPEKEEGGEETAEKEEGGEGGQETAENQEGGEGGPANTQGADSGDVATNDVDSSEGTPTGGDNLASNEGGKSAGAGSQDQVVLAPTPAADTEAVGNIDVEASSGANYDLALPGIESLEGGGKGPDQNFSEAVNDDIQSVENTVLNSNNGTINLGNSALVEFDWKKTQLVDVDGFLFGQDATEPLSFLIIGENEGFSPHPNIRLDKDCVAASCSEVILIDSFPASGLYGVGMYLDPDDNSSSDFAANSENLFISINQGGTLQRTANGGSEVVGGVTLRKISPPSNGQGDAWVAAQINAADGEIRTINQFIDTTSDTIDLVGFPALSEIANQIEVTQSFISSNIDITAAAFIEFDWTGVSLIIDGFLFGNDSVAQNFLVDVSNNGLSPHPNISLDKDCASVSCSEVITISSFPSSGLYGVGMHLPSASSSSDDFVKNRESLFVRVNQGGTLQRTSNGGSTVTGGTTVARFSPPSTGTGDTWVAAQVSASDGKIAEVNQIIDVKSNSLYGDVGAVNAIKIDGFSDLTAIANQIDGAQSIIKSNIDITAAAFIEFDWTGVSLVIDGFLFGNDSVASNFLVDVSNNGLSPHPNISLDKDCAAVSCSEVITISSFPSSGLYGVGMYLPSASSSSDDFVKNREKLFVRVNQGGKLERTSSGGSTVTGGTTIARFSPPSTGTGDTWFAAKISAVEGRLAAINQIVDIETNKDISIQGFADLTSIANSVNSIQSIVNATLNVSIKTMLEFNWTGITSKYFDSHLNGPKANGGTFHVYWAVQGQTIEGAKLENDCLSNCTNTAGNQSEVITIEEFNSGGLYRASLHGWTDKDTTNSTFIADNNDKFSFRILQNGTLSRGNNGSAIVTGGTEIFKLIPPNSGIGNTWVAANIDPSSGQIQTVNKIVNYDSASTVTGIVSQ